MTPPDTRSVRKRLLALAAITGAGFLLILGQLWYLQILEGPRLRELSERNRIRVLPARAPRGMLYDRNRLPLVETRPSFTLSIIPREVEDPRTVLARLSILLKIPFSELDSALRQATADSPWPVRISHGLTLEEITKVEEWRLELPGVVVEVEPQRAYPSSRFAAHLLGYVREADEERLRRGGYRPGDLAGQSGLERLLDEYLRGRDGGEQIEVDALGRPVRVIRRQEPRPGASVVTALDRRVQEVAERALGDQPGAVVVLDPRNGDVLAMASTPAFDLTRFAGPMEREEWIRLVRDPWHPLLNRTLQGQYAPGSVFKIVVAAAALEEGIITPSDRLSCPASLQIGRRTFRNWKDEDQGHTDLYRALVTSCNTFFYQLGLKVGMERIARYARAFGFGQATGIALPGEKVGLVPTPAWKRERFDRPWLPGDTANVSIGQGQVLVSPLQVARFMAAIANGGLLWRPRLVQRVENPSGAVLESVALEVSGRVTLSPAVFAFLQRSLWGVVNDGGTGAAARVSGLAVAGKTGTAQTIRDSDSTKGQDHAWFVGYAPAHDPQVVVVVLLEGGGKGGQAAAPVARRIFQEIFFQSVAMRGIGTREVW